MGERHGSAAREWLSVDAWWEAVVSMGRQGTRTVVTAVSVAWGVFMLVVLLAAGTGLENNVRWQFRDDAVNSIWVRPGETSMAYGGRSPGREIQFDNDDFDAVSALVPGIEHITGRYYIWGETNVRHGERSGDYDVRAAHPAHRYLEKTIITRGRFLNELDLSDKRKVAVIGEPVAEFLFRGAEPIGKSIDVSGISYRVAGVFTDEGGDSELNKIYIPISTAQAAYGGGESVHHIMFTIGDASVEQSQAIEADARALLAERHQFDPADTKAVRVRNNLERFEDLQQVFTWIRGFVWLVGIGTVAAGVVGVGNVMLISVRERTREIGLRKALGASPASIVGMILREALLLTATAGYAGLVAGVAVVELVRWKLPENEYVRDPSVDLSIVFAATGVLVVAGLFAGWFPSARAASVPPVEALHGGP